MSMWFYHLGEKIQDSELRTVWEPNQSENDTVCHKKHWISNGNTDFLVFLFMCLSFLLFLLYSIAFMLFRFWTCFWPRLAFWLEQMLCLDCSGIVLVWLQQYVWVHSAVVVKVSRLPLWFPLLVIRTKRAEVVSSPPCLPVSVCGGTQLQTVDCAICGCGYACLSKHLLAKSQCAVWSGGDGQLTLWSSTYLGCRCSLYKKLISSVPFNRKTPPDTQNKSNWDDSVRAESIP